MTLSLMEPIECPPHSVKEQDIASDLCDQVEFSPDGELETTRVGILIDDWVPQSIVCSKEIEGFIPLRLEFKLVGMKGNKFFYNVETES